MIARETRKKKRERKMKKEKWAVGPRTVPVYGASFEAAR
jgi:hypothetical protein